MLSTRFMMPSLPRAAAAQILLDHLTLEDAVLTAVLHARVARQNPFGVHHMCAISVYTCGCCCCCRSLSTPLVPHGLATTGLRETTSVQSLTPGTSSTIRWAITAMPWPSLYAGSRRHSIRTCRQSPVLNPALGTTRGAAAMMTA